MIFFPFVIVSFFVIICFPPLSVTADSPPAMQACPAGFSSVIIPGTDLTPSDKNACILIGDSRLTYDEAVTYCTEAASLLLDVTESNKDAVVALLQLEKRLKFTFWLRAAPLDGPNLYCRYTFHHQVGIADCRLRFRPLCRLDKDLQLAGFKEVVNKTALLALVLSSLSILFLIAMLTRYWKRRYDASISNRSNAAPSLSRESEV